MYRAQSSGGLPIRKLAISAALFLLMGVLVGCAAAPYGASQANVRHGGGDGSIAVTDFGAVGDGRHDDSAGFARALGSGSERIFIPPGRYRIGPAPLRVPAGVQLVGVGNAALVAAKGTQVLLQLSDGVQISNLAFAGDEVAKGGYDNDGLISARQVKNITLRDLQFRDVNRVCIMLDHADNSRVEDCGFDRIGMAIHVSYSHFVWIFRNSVDQASLHGIEIWGNWKFQRKDCSDITVIGNNVRNIQGAAIWSSGAERCVFADNVVDGATDVGLDFEWTDDSTMTGNVVQRCKNAGLSLFFSCQRITLCGNTIYNNAAISVDPGRPAGWWVRSGIWLTGLNRGAYPEDSGHRDVSITGNTIVCAPGERRSISIGKQSIGVRLADNQLSGGNIRVGSQNISNENGTMQITAQSWETPEQKK